MSTKVTRRVRGHRISWFVYGGEDGRPFQKLPYNAKMAGGGWFAWDAECECGWESQTGGDLKSSVERDVRSHKFDVTGDWRML